MWLPFRLFLPGEPEFEFQVLCKFEAFDEHLDWKDAKQRYKLTLAYNTDVTIFRWVPHLRKETSAASVRMIPWPSQRGQARYSSSVVSNTNQASTLTSNTREFQHIREEFLYRDIGSGVLGITVCSPFFLLVGSNEALMHAMDGATAGVSPTAVYVHASGLLCYTFDLSFSFLTVGWRTIPSPPPSGILCLRDILTSPYLTILTKRRPTALWWAVRP